MQNSINLIPCEFKDVRTGEVTHGFRMYDDYSKTYCNIMEGQIDNDLEFFREVVTNYSDEIVEGFIDILKTEECDLFIGDECYSSSQIKKILANRK